MRWLFFVIHSASIYLWPNTCRMIIVSSILITLARLLKPWHVVMFWIGFAFDVSGTLFMHKMAEGKFDLLDSHTLTWNVHDNNCIISTKEMRGCPKQTPSHQFTSFRPLPLYKPVEMTLMINRTYFNYIDSRVDSVQCDHVFPGLNSRCWTYLGTRHIYNRNRFPDACLIW